MNQKNDKQKEELLYSLKIEPEKRGKSAPPWSRRKKMGIAAVGLMLTALIFLIQYILRPPKVEVVRAEVIQEGLPEIDLTAGGYVVADSTILVSSQINGRVKRVLVEEGDKVKEGQVIAEIEDNDYRAKFSSANAELELAAVTLRRKQNLFQKGVISRAELDEAERAYGVSRAAYDSAKYFYENTKVKAPIDGTIIKKEKEPGEYLLPGITSEGVPGSAVMKIADLRVMNVEMDILESDLPKIRMNQPAVVFPDALPDRSYKAKLFYVSPQADRQKSIVLVKVRIENPDELLRPEMSARVYLLKSQPEKPISRRVVIPASALVHKGNEDFVFVVKKEALIEIKVEIASRQDEKILLKSGLEGDEAVVLKPRFGFYTGKKVEVKTSSPTG